MRAATIIRNPAASTVPSMSDLEAAAASLTNEWRIEIWNTLVKGDAEHLAREAAEARFDVVFACGGDGTANEVANGLAGTRATFGLIRGGLTNVLADELEIPEDLEAAVGVLRDGQIRHIDVGLANGRRFLLQAGVGFDASVVRDVSPWAKRTFGKLPFVLRGLDRLFGSRGQPTYMTVEGDAKVSQLFWLLLSNTPTYAGVRIAADAAVNDGLLDSCLVEGNGGLHAASTAARVVLNPGGDAIAASKVAHLSIKTPGIPIQIDGEDIGNTPVDFGVSPGALPILLPPGAGQHLFKEPESEPLRVWHASSAHLINATSTEVGEVIPLEADVAHLDPLAAQVDDSRVTRSRSQSESVSSKR